MASSPSHLSAATPTATLGEQAEAARQLISANELYNLWNSDQASKSERLHALKESRALTQGVLAELPDHISALNLMARIELDAHDFDAALQLLDKARNRTRHDENIELSYGYLLLAQREYALAEEQFNTILLTHRQSVRAFSGLALAKLRKGDFGGAMLHYKRLIELGSENPQHRNLLLDALENLEAERYDASIEALLLEAFSWDDVDHSKLGLMSACQLVAKYQLDDEQAILDLDALLADDLLLHAIANCLLPRRATESLIVELRRTILTEVCMTDTLRDALLPAAIAIGRFAARSDYALMQTVEEEREIAQLQHRIAAQTGASWERDDVIGALIVLSMYEPLYAQAFSFQLLRHDLSDWPQGIQALLQDNLYALAAEHESYCALFGLHADALANNEIGRASTRWEQLQQFSEANFYDALHAELSLTASKQFSGSAHGAPTVTAVPERFKTDRLNVLLLGCGSGQRAFYLAKYFDNVDVYAVDNRRENIAYCNVKARELDIDNVQFIHADLQHALISEEKFDVIEFGEAINHQSDAKAFIQEWKTLLKDDAIIRFDFATERSVAAIATITQLVKDRRLSPTIDNIRHLRDAIIRESSSGLWADIFGDLRFYSGAGCRELFFQQHNQCFNLQDIDALLKESGISFLGFAEQKHISPHAANDLAPYSLLAWHVMDQDNSLFRSRYPMYCSMNA